MLAFWRAFLVGSRSVIPNVRFSTAGLLGVTISDQYLHYSSLFIL